MKTNKLPQSDYADLLAAGSQSGSDTMSKTYDTASDHSPLAGSANTNAASNDAEYDSHNANSYSAVSNDFNMNEGANDSAAKKDLTQGGYKKAKPTMTKPTMDYQTAPETVTDQSMHHKPSTDQPLTPSAPTAHDVSDTNIPERVFMNSLIKHTGIALAIIIPLAAFTAYAAPQTMPINKNTTDTVSTEAVDTKAVEPSDIIHKSATTPTTVDNVDLAQYAGTWYEIGRLPMYFQRNCARDVTATYTPKTDGSGITVLNQCISDDGSQITAEGLAKPADNTGSKLKVTFLPSWIRWLPVGRADYWVLARDANYQTALVGTPDKDYLWLLARSPDISQQTYAKYRQIAQEQGYDLKEFQLTAQSQQSVNLVP